MTYYCFVPMMLCHLYSTHGFTDCTNLIDLYQNRIRNFQFNSCLKAFRIRYKQIISYQLHL